MPGGWSLTRLCTQIGTFLLIEIIFHAGWFEIDETHNHNVYVSGLPLDVTVDEFTEVMSKCGIIANDDKG